MADSAEDNPDILDNRFVRHMVQYCATLSSRIANASKAQARQLAARAERARKHAQDLLESDSEKVDPEIFGNQLAEMEASIAAVNSWSNSAPAGQGIIRDFCIKLENSYDYLRRTQFYKRLNADPREDEKLGIKSSIVQLPDEPYRLVIQASKYIGKQTRVFTFSGIGNVRRSPRNESMRLLELEDVRQMKVRSPGLEKKAALWSVTSRTAGLGSLLLWNWRSVEQRPAVVTGVQLSWLCGLCFPVLLQHCFRSATKTSDHRTQCGLR